MSLRDTMSVRQSVRAALNRHERVVLAVSGGLDSMVLLDAAAAVSAADRLTVATYDHGTGAAASTARSFVEQRSAALGVACVGERAADPLQSEAELRDARWNFLGRVAADRGAVVCTAHTADDQIETVLMRVMRDAGARGIAGLLAGSAVLRPMLRLTRRQLVLYARSQGLSWVEDPSNSTPRYLRNRVRNDLLPALRRVRPSVDEDLLALGRKAARWRLEVESFVAREILPTMAAGERGLDVPAASLANFTRAELAVLWPAIAAHAGVALDRRGIERLAAFTIDGQVGTRIQISGGWDVVRARDAFEIRESGGDVQASATLALSNGTEWGAWSFRPAGPAHPALTADCWSAWLPVDRPLSVRPWEPGDAMRVQVDAPLRKVKHFLSDAGVTGHRRAGWPVVLAGDQIVWIPGVRRGDAATPRSGRPGLPFICEYLNR